jgi:hypothetical protein
MATFWRGERRSWHWDPAVPGVTDLSVNSGEELCSICSQHEVAGLKVRETASDETLEHGDRA